MRCWLARVVSTLIAGAGLWFLLPDVARLNRPDPALTVEVAREGATVEQFPVGERNGLWVRLAELSPECTKRLIEMTGGPCFSSWSFLLGWVSDFFPGQTEPGTCSGGPMARELVEFLYPWTRGGGRGVLREMIVLKLVSSLSPRRLLELYLNTARFGVALYGVGEAARRYYQTDPRFLSPEQCEALGRKLGRMRAARYGGFGAALVGTPKV